MHVYIDPVGNGQMIYDESFDLRPLGQFDIRRASHVEPTGCGNWTADLSPLAGPVSCPVLGPFTSRSQALTAEVAWLEAWFTALHGVPVE